jgi:hypothetical protein
MIPVLRLNPAAHVDPARPAGVRNNRQPAHISFALTALAADTTRLGTRGMGICTHRRPSNFAANGNVSARAFTLAPKARRCGMTDGRMR